ncbi:MAG: LPS export ABC transporter permease LptG [Hyphomicrobiaceae bacterium]|nr:LPS export ABC transporter permease LptG [Hyphomicrobiaceae bacterium]
MIAAFGTLGRYLARRFLITILGTFMLCLLLIFMIDFVELLRQSGKFGAVSAFKLIYMTLLRLPAYAELTLPFAVLVGSIAAFLILSRKSELTVIRAAGVSVWQFMLPGLLVTLALGVIAVTLYNPMAASARAKAERLFAEAFGRQSSLLRTSGGGAWLRQDGADGPSVITAAAVADNGLSLTGVMVFQYDARHRFLERIDAKTARLNHGYWELRDVWVTRDGAPPEHYSVYVVSTYLTPERVLDALGSVISLSFWQLPGLIEIAEKAGLPAARYRVQYQLLLSRPALLLVMVLLGATVSLRSFRFGGIQTMVVIGMGAGFSFFLLAEVARQIGVAGLAPAGVVAWVPALVGCCVALWVLVHQEDG